MVDGVEAEAAFWSQAAQCYELVDEFADAARCYRNARLYRRAADLFLHCGQARDAAAMYAQAGRPDVAGWLLAHVVGEIAEARAVVDVEPIGAVPALALLRRLVQARCDLAERGAEDRVLATLAEAQDALAGSAPVWDQRVEEWAVAIAELVPRHDHVALTFAAAVRGHRPGAAARWSRWAADHYGVPLVLPVSGLAGEGGR